MRDSLLPHGDGVSILPLLAFAPQTLCAWVVRLRAGALFLPTRMDTLFFLLFPVQLRRIYTAQYD